MKTSCKILKGKVKGCEDTSGEGEREGRRQGGRKRGSVGGIFRSLTDCIHVFESLHLFICLLPSTPLLIDEMEKEEGYEEEKVNLNVPFHPKRPEFCFHEGFKSLNTTHRVRENSSVVLCVLSI